MTTRSSPLGLILSQLRFCQTHSWTFSTRCGVRREITVGVILGYTISNERQVGADGTFIYPFYLVSNLNVFWCSLGFWIRDLLYRNPDLKSVQIIFSHLQNGDGFYTIITSNSPAGKQWCVQYGTAFHYYSMVSTTISVDWFSHFLNLKLNERKLNWSIVWVLVGQLIKFAYKMMPIKQKAHSARFWHRIHLLFHHLA